MLANRARPVEITRRSGTLPPEPVRTWISPAGDGSHLMRAVGDKAVAQVAAELGPADAVECIADARVFGRYDAFGNR